MDRNYNMFRHVSNNIVTRQRESMIVSVKNK